MRINERIRINQIRVIADDGGQLGVMTPQAALVLAKERGLDLVEVAPLASPPVCRIMDYNKFRYEQDKRDREAKRKHHIARLKEMKFKPHIEAHDYQVKLQQLQRFLMRGDKVKVTMVYRGRELSHLDLGRRILNRLSTDLQSVARVERDPLLEGRFMSMIYAPDPAALKRLAKQQQKQATARSAASSSAAATSQPQSGQGGS